MFKTLTIMLIGGMAWGGGLAIHAPDVWKHPKTTDCGFVLPAVTEEPNRIARALSRLWGNRPNTVPDERPSTASFLQAIRDRPDDEALRLVFADVLEERGELLEAQFVRDSVALAVDERELYSRPYALRDQALRAKIQDQTHQLMATLNQNKARWMPRYTAGALTYWWQAGTLTGAHFTSSLFAKYGRQILSAAPTLTLVHPCGFEGRNPQQYARALEHALNQDAIRLVHTLGLGSQVEFNDGARLLGENAESLRELRGLAILITQGRLASLSDAVYLPKLEALTFGPAPGASNIGPSDVSGFRRAFPSLRRLLTQPSMCEPRSAIGSATLQALMDSGLPWELLDLGHYVEEDIDLGIVGRSPHSGALREVHAYARVTSAALKSFVESPLIQPPFRLYAGHPPRPRDPEFARWRRDFLDKFGETSLILLLEE